MTVRARARARALHARLHRLVGRDSEAGQALVVTILSLFVMIAMTAYVIDVGNLELAHHHAQVAADAGALAAAGEMEDSSATPAQVGLTGTTIAQDNTGGTITVTQPQGSAGAQAQATVNQQVHLPFANVLGLGNGSVSATSVAEDQSQSCTGNSSNCPTGTEVADGNISAAGCGNTDSSFCEYYYTCVSTCPVVNSSGVYGPAFATSTGPWKVTAYPVPQGVTSTSYVDVGKQSLYPYPYYNAGKSSVDLQGCSGALANNQTSCANIPSIDGSAADPEVVDLNGDSEGGMWETIQTVPGAKYELEFVLTGNPAGYDQTVWSGFPDAGQLCPTLFPNFTGDIYITNNPNDLTNGSTQYTPGTSDDTATVLASATFSHPNNQPSVATFQTVTVDFTASSGYATITFNSTTGDNNELPCFFYGPEVTNITLEYPADALVQ